MVVNGHGNHLLSLLLADHVLVQPGLDLVRSRDILHGQRRLFVRFLADLLLLGNLHTGLV